MGERMQHVEVPLSQGRVTIIDFQDAPVVLSKKWFAQHRSDGRCYAARVVRLDGGKRTELLHRVLMQAPSGIEVDHINGDTLDNRRSNLRLATHQQNVWNRKLRKDSKTGIKGVARSPIVSKPWRAYIRVNGHRKHLGYFTTAAEAAAAYDAAAVRFFGEFARPNSVCGGGE